ncbi:MAG: transcriptional regulator [Bacillales bacterium]|jgi:MarR family 2-MHQ and catechol resistance regulon transcriptional repressor|nr:transcriptional regulator [Bacillales bacterium]
MELNQSKESLKLFVVLSKAHRAITDYTNKFISEAGLNPTEFAVLEMLYHKGDTPLQKIGGQILIASGSITYVVDKLEKKGFMVREHCKKDRRVIYARITDEGKKFMDDFFPKHEQKIDEIMSVLSPEEKQNMITLLKQIGKEPSNKL